jgi:hypothetical protein
MIYGTERENEEKMRTAGRRGGRRRGIMIRRREIRRS